MDTALVQPKTCANNVPFLECAGMTARFGIVLGFRGVVPLHSK